MALTILIVDDEPVFNGGLARWLRREGHVVFEALSALEAIAIIDREPLDLAIIDYELGTSLTGLDVAKHTKVGTERIMITGYDPSEMRPRVEDPLALFRAILGKPLNYQRLFALIDHVVKSKEDTKP